MVFSLYKHSLFYGQKLLTASDCNSGNYSIEFNNKHGFIKLQFTFILQNRLRSVTLIKKTPVQVFSCEFCKIFKNPFWQKHLWTTASGFFSFSQLFATQWTNRNQVFSIFEHVLSQLSNMMNIMNFTSRNRQPSCSCWETDIPRDTRS